MAKDGIVALLAGLLGGYGQGRTQQQQRADEMAARALQQKNREEDIQRQGIAAAPSFWSETDRLPDTLKSATRQQFKDRFRLFGQSGAAEVETPGAPVSATIQGNGDNGVSIPLASGRGMFSALPPGASIADDGSRDYGPGSSLDVNAKIAPSAKELADKIALMAEATKYAGTVAQSAVGGAKETQQGAVTGANQALSLAGLPGMPVPFAQNGVNTVNGPLGGNGDIARRTSLPPDARAAAGFPTWADAAVNQKSFPKFNPGIEATPDTQIKQAELANFQAQAAQRKAEADALPIRAKTEYEKAVADGDYKRQTLILQQNRLNFDARKADAEFQDKAADRVFRAAQGDANRANQQDVARIQSSLGSIRDSLREGMIDKRAAQGQLVKVTGDQRTLAAQYAALNAIGAPTVEKGWFGNTTHYPTVTDAKTGAAREMTEAEYNTRMAQKGAIKASLDEANSLIRALKEQSGLVAPTKPGFRADKPTGKFKPPPTSRGRDGGGVLPGGRTVIGEGGRQLSVQVVAP